MAQLDDLAKELWEQIQSEAVMGYEFEFPQDLPDEMWKLPRAEQERLWRESPERGFVICREFLGRVLEQR